MQIGDRVRLLRQTGEGFIIKIIDANNVEVEMDDGFPMAFSRKEVVPIAQEEAKVFRQAPAPKNTNAPTPTSLTTQGVFLAWEKLNSQLYQMLLINNSNNHLLATLSIENGTPNGLIFADKIPAGQYAAVHKLSAHQLQDKNNFIISWMRYQTNQTQMPQNGVTAFVWKPKMLTGKTAPLPLRKTNGISFMLEMETKQETNTQAAGTTTKSPDKLSPEIDIHIELLHPAPQHLRKSEMLDLQITTFEKYIDKAIIAGLSEVTIIHGVGNGVLKNAITTLALKHPHIRHIKPAPQTQYGEGATLLSLK